MNSLVKKIISNRFNVWIIFFSIVLFLVSCNKFQKKPSSQLFKITPKERVWMNKFFNDLMIDEHGIYTLWGSKPLTLIIIDHYTEKERQEYYESLSASEKENGIIIEKYDLPENWKKWEEICPRFPFKKYLLFKSDLYDDPHASFIFFVDIFKTALVIQENYETFKKAVGFDFNPLEVVLEMQQNNSKFWEKLKGSAVHWGLLYGFGPKNSWTFHWKNFEHPSSCENFLQSFEGRFSNPPIKGKVKFALSNLEIPSFISFDENDEIIDQYKKQRLYIQNIYKGKDFLDATLEKLMQ